MSKAAAFVMPTACDEDIADDADEPPEELDHAGKTSFSDGEFAKYSHYSNPVPKQSLLTRQLLASPTIKPSNQPPALERGMSNCSLWSNGSGASTAELTSDTGLTSPSRANTPSPPPPEYIHRIAGILAGIGGTELPKEKPTVPDNSDTMETLGKKRCITFACGGERPAPRPFQDDVKKSENDEVAPPKKCTLTFQCTQRQEFENKSPPRTKISFAAPKKPEIAAPVDAIPIQSPPKTYSRSFYDSESAGDSWTYHPYDKSKLICVDDVLEKEKRIRKLSREVEAEAFQDDEEDEDNTLINEEDEDDEDNEDYDGDDGEDEDEDDEDEEDEEDDYDEYSGNETDNEEGFASDGVSDDDAFYDIHPPMVPPPRSPIHFSSPWQIRAPSPELPDSTDFVCGTFDEDKPLEEAYLSCLESRKRSKHKATPQDIDPSFPTSDSEDSDNDDEDLPSRHSTPDTQNRGRVRRPVSPPQQRAHTPPPNLSRRGSRALSPPPPKRKTTFQGNTILRSRSLPRRGKSFKIHSAHASPQRTTKPMVIRRGAMDIVKGLEKKRERRKAKKEQGWKAGVGAEKMREIALEICGKGKAKPIWVISA